MAPTDVRVASGISTVELFGVEFFSGNLASAADAVIERARSSEGGYACLCNVHVLMSGQRDQDVYEALREAWMVFPDGAPIAWLQRRHGADDARRVAGADLMMKVFEYSDAANLRHYLYGSTTHVLERLHAQLERVYPGCIVGAEAPPFGPLESLEVTDQLRKAHPDVVWCSLGAPKQELWMRRVARELRPALILGIGAAFDFVSGTRKRAPEWMQRTGLEWAHRLACEPRRLGGRYLASNTAFFMQLLVGGRARTYGPSPLVRSGDD